MRRLAIGDWSRTGDGRRGLGEGVGEGGRLFGFGDLTGEAENERETRLFEWLETKCSVLAEVCNGL